MLGLVSHTYNPTWKMRRVQGQSWLHETFSKNSNKYHPQKTKPKNLAKHQNQNKITVKADLAQLAL